MNSLSTGSYLHLPPYPKGLAQRRSLKTAQSIHSSSASDTIKFSGGPAPQSPPPEPQTTQEPSTKKWSTGKKIATYGGTITLLAGIGLGIAMPYLFIPWALVVSGIGAVALAIGLLSGRSKTTDKAKISAQQTETKTLPKAEDKPSPSPTHDTKPITDNAINKWLTDIQSNKISLKTIQKKLVEKLASPSVGKLIKDSDDYSKDELVQTIVSQLVEGVIEPVANKKDPNPDLLNKAKTTPNQLIEALHKAYSANKDIDINAAEYEPLRNIIEASNQPSAPKAPSTQPARKQKSNKWKRWLRNTFIIFGFASLPLIPGYYLWQQNEKEKALTEYKMTGEGAEKIKGPYQKVLTAEKEKYIQAAQVAMGKKDTTAFEEAIDGYRFKSYLVALEKLDSMFTEIDKQKNSGDELHQEQNTYTNEEKGKFFHQLLFEHLKDCILPYESPDGSFELNKNIPERASTRDKLQENYKKTSKKYKGARHDAFNAYTWEEKGVLDAIILQDFRNADTTYFKGLVPNSSFTPDTSTNRIDVIRAFPDLNIKELTIDQPEKGRYKLYLDNDILSDSVSDLRKHFAYLSKKENKPIILFFWSPDAKFYNEQWKKTLTPIIKNNKDKIIIYPIRIQPTQQNMYKKYDYKYLTNNKIFTNTFLGNQKLIPSIVIYNPLTRKVYYHTMANPTEIELSLDDNPYNDSRKTRPILPSKNEGIDSIPSPLDTIPYGG